MLRRLKGIFLLIAAILLNMQRTYDLKITRQDLGDALDKILKLCAA